MTIADYRVVAELGLCVKRIAGEEVKEKVMEGSDRLKPDSCPSEFAEWVVSAIERLDDLVDEEKKIEIMNSCGYNCSLEYQEVIQSAKERYERHSSLDEFLEAEQANPFPGMRMRREGDILNILYEPSSFETPMRCYCNIMRKLPSEAQVSLTYCRCSEGFIKSYWEEILGRPVRVEILESVLSGGKACRFAVHLCD
jgi:hypothetical protein